jgi:parallel beta-helix repeat protein
MMVSELTSRFSGRAHCLVFFLVAAASVLFALQLKSYAQNANERSPEIIPGKGDQVVNVKAYGAVGDGVTNDTVAFNKALAACAVDGGTCLVPEGTYLISASGISTGRLKPSVLSDVHLKGGAAPGASILKIAGMPTDNFLPCEGDNWSVENLTFDMGDYTPPLVGFAAIACRGNNWRVVNCAVIKSGRWGIAAFGGSNWMIEGNYIRRTVPGATPPIGAILVTAQKGVWSSHGRVSDNVCEGAGISFSGDNGIIGRNKVSRSGSGSGIFVMGAPSTHAPTITGNICSGGSSGYDAAQGGRWFSVNGFEIWAPDAVIYNNIARDNDGGGIAIGGQNSIVVGNTAYDNGRGAIGRAGFAARVNPARGTSASHSIFIGNLAYDSRYPSHNATQDYGYLEQAAGIIDIKHFANDYNRNRVGAAKLQVHGQAVQMQFSAEIKNKLRCLINDPGLPDNARRAVRQCLAR